MDERSKLTSSYCILQYLMTFHSPLRSSPPVPIYTLVMGFAPKHAIPLSNVTVFGGSVANCWLNSGKRHPERDRGLVDWDLILVMEPVTILGALMGAILNKVLPSTLLSVLLVILLSATAGNTIGKARKMWRKEEEAIRTKSSVTAMAGNLKADKSSEGGDVEMARTTTPSPLLPMDDNEIDIEDDEEDVDATSSLLTKEEKVRPSEEQRTGGA